MIEKRDSFFFTVYVLYIYIYFFFLFFFFTIQLMQSYCERQGKSFESVRFLYEGNRIHETDTPESVNIYYFINFYITFNNFHSFLFFIIFVFTSSFFNLHPLSFKKIFFYNNSWKWKTMMKFKLQFNNLVDIYWLKNEYLSSASSTSSSR